ncbi:hypothetical protein BG005_002854 [Podila minutissima]|nr:hypothetical protein BG005_002854 [Podila minutissima]
MRILTIAICLVAVVCVAAESPPGQEEQAYFALADHVGVIREAEFYGHLLSDFDPITPYNIIIPAAPIDLTSPTERTLDKILGVLPIDDYIRNFIDKTAHDITRMLHEGWRSFNLVGVRTALGTLHFLLNGIAAMPIPLLVDIFKILSDAVKAILELLGDRGGHGACTVFELADFYRDAVANTLESPPALTEVSAEIKRLVKGSATILDVMSKSSIAATNEDILTIRPIFGTAELLQYRDELLHLSESEEIQKYAAGALGVVISSSNALKACIIIATNVAKPTEGSNEVNKEIDQIEDEN